MASCFLNPIGAARDAGFRRHPVLTEFFVDAVAALRRLGPGEAHAGFAHGIPVDIALITGDVDVMDLEIGGGLYVAAPRLNTDMTTLQSADDLNDR
jgi:hypothetical protein